MFIYRKTNLKQQRFSRNTYKLSRESLGNA